jgi:RNA recognition motif-containing protein
LSVQDSVPAGLTKDKKRLRDQEVAVHLAWKSTLYVTNFPESADDASMRELFGKVRSFSHKYSFIESSAVWHPVRRSLAQQKVQKHETVLLCAIHLAGKRLTSCFPINLLTTSLQSSAQSALELHGRELEPGLNLNVLVSNPERKKERTDQDANEREVYVAGLSKFTTKVDLEKLFKAVSASSLFCSWISNRHLLVWRRQRCADGHGKGWPFERLCLRRIRR